MDPRGPQPNQTPVLEHYVSNAGAESKEMMIDPRLKHLAPATTGCIVTLLTGVRKKELVE